MRAFLQRRKVAFTFPFVLTCWLLCFLIAKFQLFGLEQTTPELSDYTDTFNAIQSPLYAWAEVNFGSSVITGGLLFVAIAISSPMAAMYGMAAAVLGTAFAHHLLAVGHNNLANGLYGFSPILVACAFAGERLCHFFLYLSWHFACGVNPIRLFRPWHRTLHHRFYPRQLADFMDEIEG